MDKFEQVQVMEVPIWVRAEDLGFGCPSIWVGAGRPSDLSCEDPHGQTPLKTLPFMEL